MKDELAERRAAKGVLTIKIEAGDASVVRHVLTRPVKPSPWQPHQMPNSTVEVSNKAARPGDNLGCSPRGPQR